MQKKAGEIWVDDENRVHIILNEENPLNGSNVRIAFVFTDRDLQVRTKNSPDELASMAKVSIVEGRDSRHGLEFFGHGVRAVADGTVNTVSFFSHPTKQDSELEE